MKGEGPVYVMNARTWTCLFCKHFFTTTAGQSVIRCAAGEDTSNSFACKFRPVSELAR